MFVDGVLESFSLFVFLFRYCGLECQHDSDCGPAICDTSAGSVGICAYKSAEDEMFGEALTVEGSTHYEKPPCTHSDEMGGHLPDGASLCVPKCTASGGCPTDKPAGTKADPKCVLQDAMGDKYVLCVVFVFFCVLCFVF